MVVGIRSWGAYVPKYRLGKETTGWGLPYEKAICNFDEDSLTMAVAAGMNCLRNVDRQEVDALFFATTTPPYLENQNAALIATALDLPREILTTDVTGVLRAGTTAMRSAIDAINAGSARNVLVVAADCRLAVPRSELERNTGDGAAALLLTRGEGAATVEASYSMTDHMLDLWRTQGDPFVRSWEDRFVVEEGYQRVLPEAVGRFMEKHNLSPKDFARAAFYAPDRRRHADMARRLGFAPEQVQDPLFGKVGNTGAAFTLMLLIAALEEAQGGDLILAASYGDGSDVYALRATPQVHQVKKGVRSLEAQVAARRVLSSYDTYAKWREVWISEEGPRRPPPRSPSVAALWRERDQNLRLYGARCGACGYLQYPPQRVCTKCRSRNNFEFVRLSDRRGTVFTYALDYLAGTVDIPLAIAVVNFDGGGRMLTMMTDREIEEIQVGMPVEMTFRRLSSAGGVHNYYWKSMPVRL